MGGVWSFKFAVSGFQLLVGEPYPLIWSGRKMKAIATQGRSYGEVFFVGACLSRDGWVGCKMKTIATRGRSYRGGL